MRRLQGRIIKGVGGFYYVDTADGILECRARGIFRKENITPLVGDLTVVSVDTASGTGTVEEIVPRKNQLLRPPVANVSQMAVVTATANPRPSLYLVDKLVAAAEYAGIRPLVCWNKTDLESGEELAEIYRNAGLDCLLLSAETGQNMEVLREKLAGEVTVFAGNSGVGKSSILNRILREDCFATGAVSKRAERGRHTTRYSQLEPLPGGGYIIDTPGFGSLDLTLLNPGDCAALFRELAPFTENCRFRDCTHTVEKGCGVLRAVEAGAVARSRHESYCRLVQEIREARKKENRK